MKDGVKASHASTNEHWKRSDGKVKTGMPESSQSTDKKKQLLRELSLNSPGEKKKTKKIQFLNQSTDTKKTTPPRAVPEQPGGEEEDKKKTRFGKNGASRTVIEQPEEVSHASTRPETASNVRGGI